MRNVILAMTVALTLVSGTADAGKRRPAPPNVGAGRIVWFDFTTSDMQKSKDFYGKLFGWTFAPIDGTDLAVEIVERGTAIGTLRIREGAISSYNGVVYVQVDDLGARCKQVTDLGGTIAPGFPFNLTGRPGAIGLGLDPVGHPFGMYSRTPVATREPAGK